MADIKVLMMGGKRAGKTSIMAAMERCCDDVTGSVQDITVYCEEGSTHIADKQVELHQYFEGELGAEYFLTPDNGPSSAPEHFEFHVTIGERASGYSLNFTDVPGEYYQNSQHQDEVVDLIRKSEVLLIAVDTPHMMEEIDPALGFGGYHHEFNRVKEIACYLKEALADNKDPRLVIFVPLKSEKYYYKKKLNDVSQMVEKAYAPVLEVLTDESQKNLITVAVMPIITLGGLEFFKFDKEDPMAVGLYSRVPNCSYVPRFCEQPLIMALRYLVAVEEMKKKRRWKVVNLFAEKFFKEARMKDLVACRKELNELLKNGEDGYRFIQDPAGIAQK